MADGSNHEIVQWEVVSSEVHDAAAVQSQCRPGGEDEARDDAEVCALRVGAGTQEPEQEQAGQASRDDCRNCVPERERGSLGVRKLNGDDGGEYAEDCDEAFCYPQAALIRGLRAQLAVEILDDYS